jgi:hypothetical protein
VKRPAFQFYPGDWQRDAALRSCSIGARGLWIEMICIMHQAEPYGRLVVNGRAIDPATLGRMVGAKAGEIVRWQAELEQAGVYDREGDMIVSRRMVRDETVRRLRAEGGKLGGNPALMDNHKDTDKVGDKVNHQPNLTPTPSSSSSSSRSKSLSADADPAFARFWLAYPRKTQKQKALQSFAKLKPDELLLATILDALDGHKRSEQWQRGVIPHPATWLNQRRWDDELPTAERKKVAL